jgi:hypothetical protein
MVRGEDVGIGASDDRRIDQLEVNAEVFEEASRVTQPAEMEHNSLLLGGSSDP